MSTSGLVISDLHLLAKRSRGEERLEEIASQIDRCDVLVMNGDTFDFRWSTLPDEAASIEAAMAWMEVWADRFVGRELHFVVGNHDCLRTFRRELEKLVAARPQMHVHEDFLRLGDQLFLHGDCSNRRMDVAAMRLFRQGWAEDRPRGKLSSAMYDLVDKTGLCRQFHRRYFPRERTVRRVPHYLDEAFSDWRESVRDCYFGHTHLPFRDHVCDGVRFHNTGSGICGMGFQPLVFEYALETGPCV